MFLRSRFFITLFAIAALAVLGLWLPLFYKLALLAVVVFCVACFVDMVVLTMTRVTGDRRVSQKLDLGEKNRVTIRLTVEKGRMKHCYAIDEMPMELRSETEHLEFCHDDDGSLIAKYSVFPVRRGAYKLGRVLVFGSFLGFVERRFVLVEKGRGVDVYPAFSRLREKEQQARSLQVAEYGSHKRQIPANQTEFQDIREYVPGDDIRTVNWKATARAGRTMVNNYEDERSQHIYNIIDCGRTMHRTFGGVTLQDYAINASLLLSYTALHTEGDNVGLFSYGSTGIDYLPSRSGEVQLNNILKQLYSLETEYGEGDLEELCLILDRKVQRRSLVCLYTDYTTLTALERQICFLQRISRRHCLVVVMFLDRELENLSERKNWVSDGFEGVNGHNGNGKTEVSDFVERSLAKDLLQQKLSIVDRLQQNGIQCVLTYPENLSFSIVRKYMELKAKRAW